MILVLYGPTQTGKTALAIKLAKKFNGEIISVDSRQVYKTLDIGTGKVSFESKVEKHDGYWLLDGIKIRGFDLVKAGDKFTAADFIKFAQHSIVDIKEQHKLPIIAGGTGFYLKAFIGGIKSLGIPQDPKLRSALDKLATEELYQKLLNHNPQRAMSMNESDSRNPRRLIRAIEIALSISPPAKEYSPGDYLFVGLTAPNSFLYQKSDKWLEIRLEHGLIDELNKLIKNKVSLKWLDNLGLEYRWISRFLTGKTTKEVALERLKGDIHNLIRNQKTWFSKFSEVHLFDISKDGYYKKLEKTVEDWYDSPQ